MNRHSGNKRTHTSKTKNNRPEKASKPYSKSGAQGKPKGSFKRKAKDDGTIRLNKYLAHAGVCSRRDADMYIEAGVVKVNGKVVQELGYKVTKEDKVQFEDQTLRYQ